MTDDTEKRPNPIELLELQNDLYDLAVSWGSNHAQAEDFSQLRRDLFGRDTMGGIIHIQSNLPHDHPEVRTIIQKAWPHLLPPKFEVTLSDKAFLENDMTARGKLVKELGASAALDVAKRYGHDSLHSTAKGVRPDNLPDPDADRKAKAVQDRKNNPWSKEGWSFTRQMSLFKAVGPEKAAQIAASVGCRIGSVRPNPNF